MGHATIIMFTIIIHHYNKYNWETALPYKKTPAMPLQILLYVHYDYT